MPLVRATMVAVPGFGPSITVQSVTAVRPNSDGLLEVTIATWLMPGPAAIWCKYKRKFISDSQGITQERDGLAMDRMKCRTKMMGRTRLGRPMAKILAPTKMGGGVYNKLTPCSVVGCVRDTQESRGAIYSAGGLACWFHTLKDQQMCSSFFFIFFGRPFYLD